MKKRNWTSILLSLALLLCILPVRASASEPGNTLTVTFTLVGDTAHGEGGVSHVYSADKGSGRMWIERENINVPAGATAFDAFEKALAASSITFTEKSASYIYSLTRDALTLSSESNGKNSGWMYLVNGGSPTVGIRDYKLSLGDDIVFFYTDDYTKETAPSVNSIASFADVPAGAWYADAVQYVGSRGLMTGDGTKFGPDNSMTRAMFVSILYRLDGSPKLDDKAAGIPYADVASSAWFANAVYWARQNNITNGVSAERFAPDETVTREQAATLLYHYELYRKNNTDRSGKNISEYADGDSVSAYALEGMNWAVSAGILQGNDNKLLPQGALTRAQAAALLRRLTLAA